MTDHHTKTFAAGVLALFALAACDSAGNIGAQADFNESAAGYNSLRSSVNAMPPHTGADMPTSGAATYNGFATVMAATRTPTTLVGDASINANFTRGTLDGNLTNFVGTADGAAMAPYSGSIGLRNGQIGTVAPNSFTADAVGTLRSTTDVVSVDGSVLGGFRRDGQVNAAALSAAEEAGTRFVVNGRAYDGDIGIVAVR